MKHKCSTHCDWPNCTLPECIEKRPEGNTPASEQGQKRNDETLYTYYQIDLQNISLEWDTTICETLDEVRQVLEYLDIHLDDDTETADGEPRRVIVTGIGMTPISYKRFLEEAGITKQSPASLQEMGKGIFNEDKLRKEIANKWGEYGAHIEVFDLIVNQNKIMKEELQRLSDKYGYELPFATNESEDTAKQSK